MNEVVEEIIAEAAKIHGVMPEDIRGKCRKRRMVDARGWVAIRLRLNAGMTWQDVGLALGGRDHSTAIKLYRRGMERAERITDRLTS